MKKSGAVPPAYPARNAMPMPPTQQPAPVANPSAMRGVIGGAQLAANIMRQQGRFGG